MAVAMFACGEVVARSARWRLGSRLFTRPAAPRLLALVLATCVPVATAEVGLRPFSPVHLPPKQTTLFVEDANLGWRLRPGATAPWSGVQVTVNRKGLRGPEIPYDRTPRKPRLLYLGDSVTIGYGLPSYDEAYPYRIKALLEQKLALEVETIDAAVNGYSTWQEVAYFEREGLRYTPDAVIVGFVLNDVTEPLGLERFGGTGLGYQLERSYFSVDDWLSHHSSLYWAAGRLAAHIKFGPDVQKGAVARELVAVETLARDPASARVREAWSLVLSSLDKLVDLSTSHGVPCAIVIFPFTFQFEDPVALRAPQREVLSFCQARHVPCLDLLPLVSAHLARENLQPRALFLDDDHLSVVGNQVVARLVTDWLRSEPTLWSRIAAPKSGAPSR
jgi:lysophospholipase L1-like esterase